MADRRVAGDAGPAARREGLAYDERDAGIQTTSWAAVQLIARRTTD